MKCTRCGKPLKKPSAVTAGGVFGPECAVFLGLSAPKPKKRPKPSNPIGIGKQVVKVDDGQLDLFEINM
jgi:hypothetical protein